MSLLDRRGIACPVFGQNSPPDSRDVEVECESWHIVDHLLKTTRGSFRSLPFNGAACYAGYYTCIECGGLVDDYELIPDHADETGHNYYCAITLGPRWEQGKIPGLSAIELARFRRQIARARIPALTEIPEKTGSR